MLGFGICATRALAAEGEAAADKATPAAVTPAAEAEPTIDMNSVMDDCRKAIKKLGAGDAKALDSMDEEWRNSLMKRPAAASAMACLAVAENDEKFCQALPSKSKEKCLQQHKLLGGLKDVPKEKLKARLVFAMCSENSPTSECELVRDAIASSDADKCSGVSKDNVAFCKALATGDASHCKGLDEETRATCSAYALDDPKHCPSDSTDCRNMAEAFATIKKKGLAGLGDIEPGAVAAASGRDACSGILEKLAKDCGVR